MSEANVDFNLNGIKLTIQCKKEDKMKDICKNYSNKINKSMNSLLFIYEGNEVNFDLSFKDQANILDRNNLKMKVLVKKKEDNTNNININLIISNTVKSNSNCGNIDCLKNKNLLDNIKSIFFSRILFSYLDEKNKLMLIKYNKKWQNKLEIKLVNYKFYSGKYIVYKTNIKGKEYKGKTGDLLFEGEYLNGKRNGKGEEYNSEGRIIFEGEYLNGKRNGNGKEYTYESNDYDEFISDEEYSNGEGDNEKEEKEEIEDIPFLYYHDNRILIFDGQYLNGERHGKGKEYYDNGILKFEGEYLNGDKVTGKLYDENSNLYCNLTLANGLIKE